MGSIAKQSKQLPMARHLAEIKRTLQLSLPVVIGQVAVFSMSFVDTVMAGRLPDRQLALAGLGIGGAMWSALMVFTIGLLMAVQPSVAQLDGAGRHPEAAAVTRQAYWIAVLAALPFWSACFFSAPLLELAQVDAQIIPVAAGYLRAISWGAPAICFVFLLRFFSEGSGHTKPTMFYGMLGALLNIPLNYIFMFGKFGMPALGTVGCGYASAIVIWLQLAMLVVYIQTHRHYKPFELFSHVALPHWDTLRDLLKLGLPIAIAITLESGLFVAAALLIGQLGPLPAAAHLIAINFSALLFMVPLGMGSAVTVRVGNAVGRGDLPDARYLGLIGLLIVVFGQCCNMILMLVFPEYIVALYTDDAAVAALAVSLLFYAGIFQLPDGLQICATGALRGLKDTRMPMLYNLFAYWVIGLSLGYYLTFHQQLGPAGMWIGMIAGLTVGGGLMVVRFLNITRRMIARGEAA
ncbi:MAG TPA: MATE family efflux transporter [Xanthomonadales bacterium]|nr:MATE family efflux transporter [Xanthomonadales bacterium]